MRIMVGTLQSRSSLRSSTPKTIPTNPGRLGLYNPHHVVELEKNSCDDALENRSLPSMRIVTTTSSSCCMQPWIASGHLPFLETWNSHRHRSTSLHHDICSGYPEILRPYEKQTASLHLRTLRSVEDPRTESQTL